MKRPHISVQKRMGGDDYGDAISVGLEWTDKTRWGYAVMVLAGISAILMIALVITVSQGASIEVNGAIGGVMALFICATLGAGFYMTTIPTSAFASIFGEEANKAAQGVFLNAATGNFSGAARRIMESAQDQGWL